MAQDISDFQWKNRILLLVSDTLTSESLNKQLNAFQSFSEAFKKRDLVIILITPKATYSNTKAPISITGIDVYRKDNFKGIILLGKDGGVKLKDTFVVLPEIIIALIDAMPMRQSEMKY